jgi:ATP-dependent DNA ligase
MPTMAAALPDHRVFPHEAKYDGHRLIVQRDAIA